MKTAQTRVVEWGICGRAVLVSASDKRKATRVAARVSATQAVSGSCRVQDYRGAYYVTFEACHEADLPAIAELLAAALAH